MNFLKRSLWAAVATAAAAGGASAQLGGAGGTGGAAGGTGGTAIGGGTGGTGGLGGGTGGAGGLGGGTGGGGAAGGSGGGTAGTATTAGLSSVTINPPSQVAVAPQGVATSNGIGKYYANPMYQGRAGLATTSATSVANPGGFAVPLYGTNLGAATATGGAGGGRGGAGGGTSSGFGGAATSFGSSSAGGVGGGGFGAAGGGNARGAGGVGGAGTASQSGQVVSQGVPGISYTATIKFATTAVTPAQFQADLQAVVSRSSALSNPAGVQLTTGPNGAVTLRGQVKDEDEARLVEGLLRLTPGVRDVTNDLKFPKE